MLQKLRSSTASIIAKALFVLLIISFAAWGVQGYLFQAQQGDIVASVGEETITTQELAVAFQRDLRRFQSQGADLTAEQAKNLGLMELSLNGLVQGRTYAEAAKSLGMGVSEERIAQAIRTEPSFFDENGQFNRSRFRLLLNNNGISEGEFVSQMGRDLLRRDLLNSVDFSGGAPEALAKRLNMLRNEKRVAALALVALDETLDVGEPDDATIETIRQEQADRYTAPERRSATYILLTTSDMEEEVAVSEDDMRQRYEEAIGNYTIPERRSVQQIRFDDEETARKAASQLGEGRAFEAVAKEFAGLEGAALDYGTHSAGNFPVPELESTIAALAEGAVSEPVQTSFGWHIFRVTKVEPEVISEFDKVRDFIRKDIVAERVGEVTYKKSTAIQDELAGGATIEQAAQTLGLTVKSTGLVDGLGNDASDQPAADVPGGAFLDSLFVTGVGERSVLGQLEDGSYYVLRVDEIVPAALRSIDDVRAEIVAEWQEEKRRDAARERALSIVARIEEGATLDGLAESENLTISESKPFDRRGDGARSELVTPVIVGDVFSLEIGRATMAEVPEGVAIAQLKEIRAADPSAAEKQKELLGNQITSDILAQLNAALRAEVGVEIDQAAVARTPLPQ